MNQPTQKDFRNLEAFVKGVFNTTPETEYNKDAFAPFSGQIARVGWNVNDEEVELQVLVFDDGTYSLVLITPNGRKESERKANPFNLFLTVYAAEEWNCWFKEQARQGEMIARHDRIRQANLRNRFNA